MEKKHRNFPNTLRLHRKTIGYTQRQVAKLLGLHDTVQVSSWERGIVLPNAANLIKLSVLYRTYPNELYHDVFQQCRAELHTKELEHLKNA